MYSQKHDAQRRPRARRKAGGTRTMADGLAWSVNEVAAFIMKSFGPEGPKRFAEFIHPVGIPTPVQLYPSLALGASELSLYNIFLSSTSFASLDFLPPTY